MSTVEKFNGLTYEEGEALYGKLPWAFMVLQGRNRALEEENAYVRKLIGRFAFPGQEHPYYDHDYSCLLCRSYSDDLHNDNCPLVEARMLLHGPS